LSRPRKRASDHRSEGIQYSAADLKEEPCAWLRGYWITRLRG